MGGWSFELLKHRLVQTGTVNLRTLGRTTRQPRGSESSARQWTRSLPRLPRLPRLFSHARLLPDGPALHRARLRGSLDGLRVIAWRSDCLDIDDACAAA